jgi:small subunit ribosomal protein S8e
MGIVRSRLHKRKVTGGKRPIARKRRKHELGRLPANTKLGAKKQSTVRVRGGNTKIRALRLDAGNFAWGSESVAQPTRILDVVYNATSNELVRTKTLVKNAIVAVDAAPFKTWYAKQYGISVDEGGKRKKAAGKDAAGAKGNKKAKKATGTAGKFDVSKASAELKRAWSYRNRSHKIEKALEDQLKLGRILAKITTRPGQHGRADGAILEGAELAFYQKKLESKKKVKKTK